jgi:hypothetical protein
MPPLVSPPMKPSGTKIAAIFASLSLISTPYLLVELNQPYLTLGKGFHLRWSDKTISVVISIQYSKKPSLWPFLGLFLDLTGPR